MEDLLDDGLRQALDVLLLLVVRSGQVGQRLGDLRRPYLLCLAAQGADGRHDAERARPVEEARRLLLDYRLDGADLLLPRAPVRLGDRDWRSSMS